MGKARVSAAGNTGVGVLEVTLNPEQSMSVKDLGTACLAAAQAMQPTAKADAKKSLAAAAEDLLDQLEQGNTKKSGTGEKRESQLLNKRSQTRSKRKRSGPGNGPPSRKAPTGTVTFAGDKKTKEDQSEEEADEEEADDDDQKEDEEEKEDSGEDDDDQKEDEEEKEDSGEDDDDQKEDSGEDDDEKDDKKSGDTTDDDPDA